MNKSLLILISVLSFFSISCTCDHSEKSDNNDAEIESTIDLETRSQNNTSYKVPSPMDMYMFLLESTDEFHKDALHSLDDISKYQTSTSKAINFGIYASDLAYSAIYNQNQETFHYFAAAKKLAGELGFETGFNILTADEIEESFNNSDLLYQVTTDAYWNAYNYLEENGQTKVLSLIIIGGWLESVYVALNTVGEFSEDNLIIERIAEQQLILENIIFYLDDVEKDDDLEKITNQLLDLQFIFDSLYDNVDVIITKNQYDEIAKNVTALRNQLIS